MAFRTRRRRYGCSRMHTVLAPLVQYVLNLEEQAARADGTSGEQIAAGAHGGKVVCDVDV